MNSTSLINSNQLIKVIQQACKRLANVGAIESNSRISLLETSFAKGKDEVLFRTLLQNTLDNEGYITLREFKFSKKLHGSSADYLDLEFIERCDLLIRKPKGRKFDKDALVYMELKAQAYGDFKVDGGLVWDKAKTFWKDTFNKLSQYKLHHQSTECFFGLIAFGIDNLKTDGDLHLYKRTADLAKRNNFLAFRDSYSKLMGLNHLFTERILPRESGDYDWLSLDFSLFSVDHLTASKQDKLILNLYPNKLNDFIRERELYRNSIQQYQLINFSNSKSKK